MLLKQRNIISELEKIYPDIKFDYKYSEHYVNVIKFCLINKIKEEMKNCSIEKSISIMEDFTFKIERENSNLNSITKVDNSLIIQIKDILINSFNQNSIKTKKIKEISAEKQLLIFKLLLYKNFEDVSHNIFTCKEMIRYCKFYSNVRIKNTKETRELFRLKNMININREILFELLKKTVTIFNDKYVKEKQFANLNHFLTDYNSAYSTVKVNLAYDINKDNKHISFITEEGIKGYFPSDLIHLNKLHEAKLKYKEAKETIEIVKDYFFKIEINYLN